MSKFPLLFSLLMLALLTACKEEVDTTSRYVFKEYTISSYLETHDSYSEYVGLLKKVPVSHRSNSTLYQLMTARGNYTVFAPTNEAIHQYLEDLVQEGLIPEARWDAFTDAHKLDSIRKVVVLNSIINGGDISSQVYYIAGFPTTNNATFPLPNLNDKKLSASTDPKNLDDIFINGNCRLDVINRDIEAINGVIHQIHKVIAPSDMSVARYLQQTIESGKEGYLVMAKCIMACGLKDTLSAIRDEVYEDLYQSGRIPDFEKYMDAGFTDASGNHNSNALAPEHRKYGFTIFAETDDFWRTEGIDPHSDNVPEQVMEWVKSHELYTSDEPYSVNQDFTAENNLLNLWTTYHILPFKLEPNKLVYHWNEYGYSRGNKYKYNIPVMEWYATMGRRRLIKIFESAESNGVFLNRFPHLDLARNGNGHEQYCDADKMGSKVKKEDDMVVSSDIDNAYIYPIDAPLFYSNATRDNLGKERLRFDCFSLFPEAMTNGIRRADSAEDRWNHVYIPSDEIYRYFDNMSIVSSGTKFVHFNGYNVSWENYDGDEDKAMGRYDITFRLPPIPKRGVYELRYKVLATAARGVVQMYFGSNPDYLPVAGIPVDLTKTVRDLWGQSADIDDTEDEDYNADIDKKLRNNNLMKGCRSVSSGSGKSERANNVCSRRIIWRGTMDPNLTYYVRFKSVLDSDTKEFYMDYIEFCPKEVYDNPETPEDLW